MFKVKFIPPTPDEVVISDTARIGGLDFIAIAQSVLKRVIEEHEERRFEPLGRVRQFEVTIPNEVAVKSDLFNEKNEIYVTVPANFLNNYIFHLVSGNTSMANSRSRMRVYPYHCSEVVIMSAIDEFRLIQDWERLGFSTNIVNDFDESIQPNPDCDCGVVTTPQIPLNPPITNPPSGGCLGQTQGNFQCPTQSHNNGISLRRKYN